MEGRYRNERLFWKKASKVDGGKVESCNRINDGYERLAVGEDEGRIILDLYNMVLKSSLLPIWMALVCSES